MLCLTLKRDRSLDVFGPARIQLTRTQPDQCRFGIFAHPSVLVLRTELCTPDQTARMNRLLDDPVGPGLEVSRIITLEALVSKLREENEELKARIAHLESQI